MAGRACVEQMKANESRPTTFRRDSGRTNEEKDLAERRTSRAVHNLSPDDMFEHNPRRLVYVDETTRRGHRLVGKNLSHFMKHKLTPIFNILGGMAQAAFGTAIVFGILLIFFLVLVYLVNL